MLTGLARDGGLYVPETWPQLSRETIAGFFGRPYWEVAVDVIRPFAGGEISDADLGRMANEAYATFRHPAGGAAATRSAPINSCWSCFTARRWRSRTSRCS